jgi:hypothetical protein
MPRRDLSQPSFVDALMSGCGKGGGFLDRIAQTFDWLAFKALLSPILASTEARPAIRRLRCSRACSRSSDICCLTLALRRRFGTRGVVSPPLRIAVGGRHAVSESRAAERPSLSIVWRKRQIEAWSAGWTRP